MAHAGAGREGDSCGTRYLCLLDILGFRQVIERLRVEEVGLLLTNLQRDIALVAHNPLVRGSSDTRVRFVSYSDSVLLYVEEDDAPALIGLISAATAAVGFGISQGILLRGAISRGDLFVSGNRQVIAGRGLIRAYELEQAQDWGGAILDTAFIGGTDAEREAIDYCVWADFLRSARVPWNTGETPRSYPAVVWPGVLGGPSAHSDTWRRKFRETMGEPTERGLRKQEATLAFADAYSRDRANAAEREPSRLRVVERLRTTGRLDSLREGERRLLLRPVS